MLARPENQVYNKGCPSALVVLLEDTTLTCRIIVQQNLIHFSKFSNLHTLIPSYTFIKFWKKFLPTLLKHVGKIIFYLVPTRLFGTTRLLDSEKISILHDYSAGQSRYFLNLNLVGFFQIPMKNNHLSCNNH